jgi:predicted glycosyltransferase
VEQLIADHSIRMLEEKDLEPERLAALMAAQLQAGRYRTWLDLDGARQTALLVEKL